MSTITIYTITVSEAFRADETGTRFSLEPWGQSTAYYRGGDDGGELYELPEGYTVAEDQTGSLSIYDAGNNPVSLVGQTHPALADNPDYPRRLKKHQLGGSF